MENIYLNNPGPDDIYDGPTDDELKRIEDELEKYSNWHIIRIFWFLLKLLVALLLKHGSIDEFLFGKRTKKLL